MDWPFIFYISILGTGVIYSYTTILFNAFGQYSMEITQSNYFDSPYWLSIPQDTKYGLTVLQILAAFGYIYWVFWVASLENPMGPLKHRESKFIVVTFFVVSSSFWPYFSYRYILSPTLRHAIYASIPLWIAAISVIAMVAFTFEAHANIFATLSILLLANIVVLADGIGWSAICIRESS